MPATPVVLLAFANDRVDPDRFLRNLATEARGVRNALDRPTLGIEVVVRQNATFDDVLSVFQDERYRGRVAVFHFGGHAGGAQLLFEEASGSPALLDGDGIASFLGRQEGLRLVFLNGCSTRGQVDALTSAGVPAVIATSESIDDAAAKRFATTFYRGLASGATLARAFDDAATSGAAYRKGRPRALGPPMQHEPSSLWGLHPQDRDQRAVDWRLTSSRRRMLVLAQRTWWRVALLALVGWPLWEALGPTPIPAIASMELDTYARIATGGTHELNVVFRDVEGGELDRGTVWTSENPEIASVTDEGLVTGLGVGEANIKAKGPGIWEALVAVEVYDTVPPPDTVTVDRDTFNVVRPESPPTASPRLPTGSPAPPAPRFELSSLGLQLEVGRPRRIDWVVVLDGRIVSDARITWTSRDTTKAVVSDDGTVTGLALGVAGIQGLYGSELRQVAVDVVDRLAADAPPHVDLEIAAASSQRVVAPGDTFEVEVSVRHRPRSVTGDPDAGWVEQVHFLVHLTDGLDLVGQPAFRREILFKDEVWTEVITLVARAPTEEAAPVVRVEVTAGGSVGDMDLSNNFAIFAIFVVPE